MTTVKVSSNLDALDARAPYDVGIIGSGFVGTILGTLMAESGLRTVVVESGNSMLNWLTHSKLKGLAEYEVSGNAAYPATRTTARLVGGNSNFWTGRCDRFQPSDFENHAYTPDDNPWPISYSDLEPYYNLAEETLRARGGELSSFMPPRSQGLPLPATTDITPLKRIMKPTRLVIDDSPTATPRHWIRFFRLSREIMPRFLQSPCGKLVTGATATRIITQQDGRVEAIEVKALDKTTKRLRARKYIIACGGIQTPRLLLLSKSETHPEGIGNRHDRVGRGFNEHPGISIYSKINHCLETLIPSHKIGRTRQVYDMFRPEGLGAVHPVFIQSWFFPHHLRYYKFGDLLPHLGKIAKRFRKPTLYMGGTIEQKPVDTNRVELSGHRCDMFGNPVAHLHLDLVEEDLRLLDNLRHLLHALFRRIGATDLEEIEMTWSRHHMSACRMGASPKTSVVNPNLQVHGCNNLYLCGSEVFVTGAGVAPVLTITALVHRLAEHLRGEYAVDP